MTAARKNTAKPTAARLNLEDLEGREMLSWGALPPATIGGSPVADKFTINMNSSGGYNRISQISRGEADFYKFTAQRTGQYTFSAASSGSSIDTVVALYNSAGQRIASDDDSGPGTGSKMTYNLQAGRTYTVGISKYTTSPNGAYRLTFQAPSLSASAGTDDIFYAWENGSASLVGKTLTLELYGHTQRAGYYTDHYIEVKIMGRNGVPIHDGSWVRGFRTDYLPFGNPRDRSETWTFDLSSWDLSGASWLSLTVGH
jgi:hypothetical protein